ncbi:uncharacterized protein V1510DRAFT_416287 [Dipodascopsis tothii]|uniref:uncharacterized protein n=1 Tax=Dipodascopsis tothii TaxID=44089 RepID=UPI0034CF2870
MPAPCKYRPWRRRRGRSRLPRATPTYPCSLTAVFFIVASSAAVAVGYLAYQNSDTIAQTVRETLLDIQAASQAIAERHRQIRRRRRQRMAAGLAEHFYDPFTDSEDYLYFHDDKEDEDEDEDLRRETDQYNVVSHRNRDEKTELGAVSTAVSATTSDLRHRRQIASESDHDLDDRGDRVAGIRRRMSTCTDDGGYNLVAPSDNEGSVFGDAHTDAPTDVDTDAERTIAAAAEYDCDSDTDAEAVPTDAEDGHESDGRETVASDDSVATAGSFFVVRDGQYSDESSDNGACTPATLSDDEEEAYASNRMRMLALN